jgi:uncharacterized membrane protein
MESLVVLTLLVLLAGPVLAIIALVQISNLDASLRRLKAAIAQQPAAAPPAPEPEPVKSKSKAKAKSAPLASATPAKVELGAVPEMAVETLRLPSSPPKEQPAHNAPPRDMENALASRWFVWAGGIAVALGGLLFVKYAHDAGLIPPLARVIVGLFAAAALVYAGEWARKRGSEVPKGYIPAALSAAGLVIAFGVIYAAYALYGILSPAVCFPLLVAVGLGALWLSRRQGPLIAALGLIGAFVAPMLVPSENPSAVGFFLYLAVIVAASLYELRDRPWWWLGYCTIGGAFLWALMWINGFGVLPLWPIAIFGLFLGAASTLIPKDKGILAPEMGTLADPEKMAHPMRMAVAGIVAGALILGFMTLQSGHSTIALLFFAIAMAAITAFGWLRDGMVAAPLASAMATLVMLASWRDVGFHELAFDERGFWVTVPGLIEPPRFRNATLFAMAIFTAVGVAGLFRQTEKRPWAALAAGSAFLFTFMAWGRADFTMGETSWAILGIVLAAALIGSAWMHWQGAAKMAPNHSVELLMGGAAFLLIFAADRLFSGVAMTLVVAAIATVYAYAARIFPLPHVAAIATAIAGFASLRLFFGREFWSEPTNVLLGAHWVLYGYGIPVALFYWSSRILNGDAFARYRMAFEGLALGLAVALVSLELRVLIGGGITHDGMSLLELAAHAMAWLGAAYGLGYRQQIFSSFISLWGARILLGASCLAFLAALTVRNPVFTGDVVEGNTVFNSLLLAYLAPVPLLALMARKLDGLGLARLRNALGVFALVLLIAFVTLQVKRWFQDVILVPEFESQAESYSVSLAWIVTGILIFIAGLKLDRQNIRYGGLAVLVLAVLKVFAFDLFELGGLWRIASIIGLGFCLIGVGWLYTRFIQKPKAATA